MEVQIQVEELVVLHLTADQLLKLLLAQPVDLV
jgi:hypothetical protein